MLVYLLIPVALAVVFFTMSFFQKETAVVNVVEKEKTKDKKVAKKPTGVKKPVQKKAPENEQEKTISQKNFTEEIDIKELATMQGKIDKPVAPVKKEKKEEEKKVEVKEAPKEVAAVDSKKKQKKSDWVTKEVKPQRPKVEKEETEEKEEKTEKKERRDKDKKRGDKKGGDKKRGDKKEKKEEGDENKEKSIYKAFKPHGAEADKVDPKKEEEKKEETTAVVEPTEEKKEKKEKKERTFDKPLKPRLKMKYNAYKSTEDFWETNIADSYVEPAEITTVSPVPTEEKVEKKEKKERGTPKKGESREPAPAVQIKVNKQVSLARTDPWAKTDSSAQASTSDSDDYFPALGEKNVKKPKKANKASETEPTSPQKKSDSHKREAKDTLFEYEVEAPSDKKIKLGEEAEKQNAKEEEPFVLPE